MGELTETFKSQAYLDEYKDIADEPVLVGKNEADYMVHRKGMLDWGPNAGDVDTLNQMDYTKEYFDSPPKTLEECTQAQNEIVGARHDLMTEALETYNNAALDGHGPGVLEFDSQSPEFTENVQNSLRELLAGGYLGGDVQDNVKQLRADQSDFPEDARQTISENINASIVLEDRLEDLNVRLKDISSDMDGMDVTDNGPALR